MSDMKARNLYTRIWKELSADKEMVFLSGPRQAGKTTLAKMIAADFRNSLYWNWDIAADRARFPENPVFFEELKRLKASLPTVRSKQSNVFLNTLS